MENRAQNGGSFEKESDVVTAVIIWMCETRPTAYRGVAIVRRGKPGNRRDVRRPHRTVQRPTPRQEGGRGNLQVVGARTADLGDGACPGNDPRRALGRLPAGRLPLARHRTRRT